MRLVNCIKEYLFENKYLKRLSKNTINYQKRTLYSSLSDIGDIKDVNAKKVQKIFDLMKKEGLSLATTRSRYSIIMAFLNSCYQKKYISFDPYLFIRKVFKYRAHKKPLDKNELSRLLSADLFYKKSCDFQYYRNKALLGLLIYSGLRASEIVCLRKTDVYLSKRYINVLRGKGKVTRIIPIEEPLVSWLSNYLRFRKKMHSKYLFVGLFSKGKLNRNTITQIMKKIARSAGLSKKINSHLLRHSFASQMLKGGVPLEQLMILMGHKDIEMTAMYAKPDKEMINDALLSNPLISILGKGGR